MDAEERALLAAIIANPEEDTPRLVYADWLDEHADSLPKARRDSARARAELIRLQIERGLLPFGEKASERRVHELSIEIWGLQDDYTRTWAKELPAAARRLGVVFTLDRGLIGGVECTVKFFAEAGRALLGAAPVTAVRVKGLSPRNVNALVKCPHIARVRALRFVGNRTPPEPLAAFLDAAELPLLGRLTLDSFSFDTTTDAWHERWDVCVQRLAGNPKFAKLRHLRCWASGVGRTGGEALARSPHLTGLEVLDLRDNPALGAAKKSLRKSFGNRVWLEDDDRKGFPIRRVFPDEPPGG